MDTITQALLGSAVGFMVAGRQSARKSVLYGAAFGVLPDLDVLVPYANDLANVTNHRSWSHSWLVQTALAPILALCLKRIDTTFNFTTWWLLIWLALVTHSTLDALTVYGTQLFWPFMPSPYSGGSVFIIDPFYSIPLLLGFLWVAIRPNSSHSQATLKLSFIWSCCYLLWGLSAQYWVKTTIDSQFEQQQISADKVLVVATPLNTLLWRVLAINENTYFEAHVSIFDDKQNITFTRYDRQTSLLNKSDFSAIQQLAWFTNDFYKLQLRENVITASDLRMGMEPNYFFNYRVAELNNGVWQAVEPNRLRQQRDIKAALNWVWFRIWNQTNSTQFQVPHTHNHELAPLLDKSPDL
jgi:inner membrane protein